MKERICPGLKNCVLKQEGPDPCKGCKIRENLDWKPKYQTTYYAGLLANYVETFKLSPDQLTWQDFEIYQLYLTAKNEYEEERLKKASKRRSI